MGLRNRERFSEELSEALLLATMCLVDFPVDVHVRDGSIFSGVFHTASVEDQYGIVLKKASITKKGRTDPNLINEGIIETLIIYAGDLVQVVAKGVQLSTDGIAGNVGGDDVDAARTVPSIKEIESVGEKYVKSAISNKKITQTRKRVLHHQWAPRLESSLLQRSMKSSGRHSSRRVQNENGFPYGFMPANAEKEHEGKNMSLSHLENALEVEHGKTDAINLAEGGEASGASFNGRQLGADRSQGEHYECQQNVEFQRDETAFEFEVSSSSSVVLPNSPPCEKPTSPGTSSNEISTSLGPVMNFASESRLSLLETSTKLIAPHGSESNRSTKEFKLNPGAKIFSPSFANSLSAIPAVPTVESMSYISDNYPAVPVATAQTEIGTSPFAPHSSVPVKFVPYNNLIAGNGGSGSQVSQPVVGHIGSQTQVLRYAGPHHPVQAGPAYGLPNSPGVMVGRLGGQLVYVHPVSQDSQLSTARPVLVQHPVQFPKHQVSAGSAAVGQALQLCATPPPFITSGQQPFAVPSHIQLLQPSFYANRPIPVPGSNALFTTKFA